MVVSLLAIIGLGMTLLIRVLDHFSGQLLLYHRLGKILVHPLRDIDSASNTAVYVCNAMQEAATNPDQSLQAKGCI